MEEDQMFEALCARISRRLFAAEVQRTIDALPGGSEPDDCEW